MKHFPDFEQFQRLAKDHHLVPVYRRLISDALTPVSAFRRIDTGKSACLFESVIGGERVGRYSFLAIDPFLELSARGTKVTVADENGRREMEIRDPLEEIRRRLVAFKAAHPPELPRLTGGAIGYAGYDVVRYVENLPHAPTDDRQLPDLFFGFYDQTVIFDNVSKTMFVVVMARLDKGGDPATAYAEAQRRIDATVAQLSDPAIEPQCTDIETSRDVTLSYRSNFEKPAFETAVRKCIEYIRAWGHLSSRDQPAVGSRYPIGSV